MGPQQGAGKRKPGPTMVAMLAVMIVTGVINVATDGGFDRSRQGSLFFLSLPLVLLQAVHVQVAIRNLRSTYLPLWLFVTMLISVVMGLVWILLVSFLAPAHWIEPFSRSMIDLGLFQIPLTVVAVALILARILSSASERSMARED